MVAWGAGLRFGHLGAVGLRRVVRQEKRTGSQKVTVFRPRFRPMAMDYDLYGHGVRWKHAGGWAISFFSASNAMGGAVCVQ